MYRADFVGRSRELEVLDSLWNSPKAMLLILYGRRRVGKTRLLTHWLRRYPGQGLYWVAEPTSSLSQLRSFSQAIMSFMDPEADIPPEFTFSSWELALRQLARHAQEKRVALFIDEVTYLIDVDPEFVGMLQKIWDHWLSDTNLMLVLSGSQMGIMRRHLLDYQAPLYGRATAQMQLQPLPYGATAEFFPDYSAADRVALYAMWGGVPAYWERLDADLPIIENLRRIILPSHSWMVDEARILLSDFITDMHNYVGILRAIADGRQTMGEIAKRTGLASGKASFYLSVLRDTGFVTREVPVSHRNREDSRSGRYLVTDPYLRFFYRFISANQSRLIPGRNWRATGCCWPPPAATSPWRSKTSAANGARGRRWTSSATAPAPGRWSWATASGRAGRPGRRSSRACCAAPPTAWPRRRKRATKTRRPSGSSPSRATPGRPRPTTRPNS